MRRYAMAMTVVSPPNEKEYQHSSKRLIDNCATLLKEGMQPHGPVQIGFNQDGMPVSFIQMFIDPEPTCPK